MAKLKAAERKKLPADKFALPGKRMFPIHDKEHIKLAWDMVTLAKGITDAERQTARRNILSAAKKAGIDTEGWDKKAMKDEVVFVDDAGNPDICTANPQALTDDAGQPSGWYKSPVARVNVVNDNLRMYPLPVYRPALDELKAARFPIPGENPHPKPIKTAGGKVAFDSRLENQACVFRDAYIDAKTGIVYGEWKPLDSPKGKILKAIADEGKAVGFSNRMSGASTQAMVDNQRVEIATQLKLYVWDPVMNPAEVNALDVPVALTDSQVQAILDGARTTAPHCPSCDLELQQEDPDDDGETEFWSCPGCGREYDVIDDHATHHQAHQRVIARSGSLNRWNLDNVGGPENNGQGDGEMTREEMLKAISDALNSPEFMAKIKSTAAEVAKPALDAAAAADAEKAKALAKAEAKAFLDEKVAELKKGGKVDEKVIKVITDAVGEPATKDQAALAFDAAVKVINDSGAAQILASMGFTGTGGPEGQTRVEMGANQPKPWAPIVDSLVKEFDRYGEEFGRTFDPELRKLNRGIVDKILARYEELVGPKVLADSVQGFEMLSDAVSVTTAQLLNQPTILTAVLVQAFQDVESLQFLMADVFAGSEWRIPVETFTGNESADPASGLMDIVVPEGSGIPESAINLAWQSYSPKWRRNAVSLTTDVVQQLRSGPAKYEAIARAIYHIGENKRRKLDDAAYYEMILASDEYAPMVVTGEAPAAAAIVSVNNGTNVKYKYSLTGGGAVGYAVGANPIVRPRSKNQIQPNGSVQQVTTNTFTVTVNGAALQIGYLDANGNVASYAGTAAQYAVDFENGIVYFNAAAGLNPGAATPILPVLSYSAATNLDVWHYTVPNGTDPATYYNTLLQQFSATVAKMGSAPRYKKPNLAIMSLNAAVYIENAQIFYKLALPEGTRLIPTGNTFGSRAGCNLSKINAPWVAGDGRILLTQKGSTRYGIETPYAIEGPYPKYDNNGNIVDAKVWYGRENSVLCTPQVTDINGNIINPVSRTIKIVA